MSLPVASLQAGLHEIGLVVAALIGFGFGFVLERAGFGRATKLAAQFYLYDMTVLKVMFGAIVTAMLGVVLASGVGLVDLTALSQGAVSATFVGPMLVGGIMLGAGFIISGYCPGTSVVASASGNLDGLVTVAGVMVGSLLYGELFPWLESWHNSGEKGQLFLYQVLRVPPEWLAVAFAAGAVLVFIGAERLERVMTRRLRSGNPAVVDSVVDDEVRGARAPRRIAFALYGLVAAATLGTMLLPTPQPAAARDASTQPAYITPEALAERLFSEPWHMRVLDVRPRSACVAERVPGAECVPAKELTKLGLAYGPGKRTLVLVGEDSLDSIPEGAQPYPGEVTLLQGGHGAWHAYALKTPEPPPAGAGPAAWASYRKRASINAALTGQVAPPPAPRSLPTYVPKKKKKGGGCD